MLLQAYEVNAMLAFIIRWVARPGLVAPTAICFRNADEQACYETSLGAAGLPLRRGL